MAAATRGPGRRDEERQGDLYTTGQMARLSRSTLRTVRFYEEAGVLEPARRSDGGHRLFPRAELDKLTLVSDLRAAGLSLDEIKEILALKRAFQSGETASAGLVERLARQIAAMEGRIAVLAKLREDLVRGAEALGACRSCREGSFPDVCRTCGSIGRAAELPRSLRVLWDVGS